MKSIGHNQHGTCNQEGVRQLRHYQETAKGTMTHVTVKREQVFIVKVEDEYSSPQAIEDRAYELFYQGKSYEVGSSVEVIAESDGDESE